MRKVIVFPMFFLLFLVAGCGIPASEHNKTLADLADCARQREEIVVQSNLCGNQVKSLMAENQSLKKDKADLQKMKDDLQEKVGVLAPMAERADRLEMATQTYQELQKKLEREILDGKIQITEMKNRLTMTMVDKVLFPSGSADISREGKVVLDKVVPVLKEIRDRRIQVEGHTDNVRIISAIRTRYPTNWELSAARATQVVRYLQEEGGIDPAILSATGYSEYQPVGHNDSDEGKARNRRIEIVLLPLAK